MSANRCLFWFYEHLTEDINEVVKKGLALDKWAEAHGGNPPIDDSLDSHDWWDHFPLVMPPEKFFGKLPFIPPTQEGEAFANLVRGVIVERHNDNAQLWLCPYSHIEFVMLFQYDKYTSYFSHRKELVAWVAELRQAYIDLLG